MSLITDIAKLQELEQKATPVKWETEENEGGHEIRMGKAIESPGQYPCHLVIEYEHGCFEDDENDPPANTQAAEAEANAYLISNLRNLAPAMLAALCMVQEGDAEKLEAARSWLKTTNANQVIIEAMDRAVHMAALMEKEAREG